MKNVLIYGVVILVGVFMIAPMLGYSPVSMVLGPEAPACSDWVTKDKMSELLRDKLKSKDLKMDGITTIKSERKLKECTALISGSIPSTGEVFKDYPIRYESVVTDGKGLMVVLKPYQ